MDPMAMFFDDLREVVTIAAGVRLVHDLGPLSMVLGNPEVIVNKTLRKVKAEVQEAVDSGMPNHDLMLLTTHLVYEAAIALLPAKPDPDATPGPEPSEN